jgi:signal transduction histidine kinase
MTELPELLPVVADADRLTQVFTNLLDNALKYTPKDGRVQINARQVTAPPGRNPGLTLRRSSADTPTPGDPHAGWIVVSVSDTGCGIPAEDLPRVFERFYQVDKARAARQGYGLGLAIAKEIVEAHGGRIGVESLEGMGTRFTVMLPVASTRS